MRVLTFNSHQPYLHILATVLPWTLGVVTPRLPAGKVRSWNLRIRPLPPNVRLYPSLNAAIEDSAWDWALTHNVQDLVDVGGLRLPKVFLVHGTLSGRILQDGSTIERSSYLKNLQVLLAANRCRVVYISSLKKNDWGIPGEVIRTAIDSNQYGGYRGEHPAILQVCNHLKERASMLGWESHQIVCGNLPSLILGENRDLPRSRMAADWEDLKEQYRLHRIYLHTSVYPYEDGYNLALLEAMATGMPVATMRHPTSPIEDGVDGVVGGTGEELRERVVWLLDKPQECASLGTAARKKLEREFPLSSFQYGWESLAAKLV